MARTVKPQEYASKRGEILDAAQRMIFTKGFEQTSVRDILDELRISNGAFHHYFGSREALLDGLIERIRQGSELPLLPIVHDPHLTAIEKLQGFFDTLDGLRMAHKADVAAAMRVWYTDDNALVRQKVDEAVLQQRAPLVVEIVRQGIQEGVFTTAYPDQAGEVVLAMLQGMGNAHARLLLSLTREGGAEGERIQPEIEKIVSIHVAYMDAIERVLGAPPNCLHRADLEAVKVWAVTLRGAGRE
jgi:TetR/AcrR family transcriptional regulator, transcriptional repressor for nem operon